VTPRDQEPQQTARDHGPVPRAARSPQEEAAAIAELIKSQHGVPIDQTTTAASLPAAPVANPHPRRPADFNGGVVGPQHSGRPLGKLLVDRGFLVESQLQHALTRQASTGTPLGQILVDLGLITDRDLVELLAEQLRLPVVELARIDCDPAVSALLPNQQALQLAALPFRRVGETIDVAIADPTDDEQVAALIETLNAPLRLFLATRADIEAAIERLHHRNRP
jgi:Type II secretion system (T2SS), protein E, N-terminal domain